MPNESNRRHIKLKIRVNSPSCSKVLVTSRSYILAKAQWYKALASQEEEDIQRTVEGMKKHFGK